MHFLNKISNTILLPRFHSFERKKKMKGNLNQINKFYMIINILIN
jgi:hypothetical protein